MRAAEQLRCRISLVRQAGSDEVPQATILQDGINVAVIVTGSDDLLATVRSALEGVELTLASENVMEEPKPAPAKPPVAFLCYATEDSGIAERIARALITNGINTFWDKWEIRSGESIRQRIEQGLGACTHFMALLTPRSVQKPWVNAEMDAGFLGKLSGRCHFIALRVDLPARELPPLIGTLHSPQIELSNFEADMRTIVGDVLGVTRKPALGRPPVVFEASASTRFSTAANRVAQFFVERSEHGLSNDPHVSLPDLVNAVGMTKDEVIDGIDELDEANCAIIHDYAGGCDVASGESLFVEFDALWTDHDPASDARRLAQLILERPEAGHSASELADRLTWPARRLNPALQYLLSNGLIEDDQTLVHPWLLYRVRCTRGLRRWARDT